MQRPAKQPAKNMSQRRTLGLVVTLAVAIAMPLAACGASGKTVKNPPKAVQVWAQEIYFEALENMADEAGIRFYPDGVPAVLPETYEAYKGPKLTDFAADPKGRLFSSAEAQARFVNEPFTVAGPVTVARSVLERDLVVTRGPKQAGGAGTLMVVQAFISDVSVDYYTGSLDRTSVTTMVFVIDIESRTVRHIEFIGYHRPGDVISGLADTHPNLGKWKADEAYAYIDSLT